MLILKDYLNKIIIMYNSPSMIMHVMSIVVVVQKSNTFGYVVIHNEFEVFTAAGHSHRVPLIVVELLSGIKNLRAFA